MNENELTPTGGEWCVIKSRDVHAALVSKNIATIAIDFDNEADAILCSAAPEMLAACRAVLRCLNYQRAPNREGEPPNPLTVVLDRTIAQRLVESAIAKATGAPQ